MPLHTLILLSSFPFSPLQYRMTEKSRGPAHLYNVNFTIAIFYFNFYIEAHTLINKSLIRFCILIQYLKKKGYK